MYKSIAGYLLTLALTLAMSIASAAPNNDALNRIVKVDIRAQSLSTALIEFSKQAGVQVITSAGKVSNLETRGVQGKMPLSVALAKLLQGTKLSFHSAGANSVGLNDAAKATPDTTSAIYDNSATQLALINGDAVDESEANAGGGSKTVKNSKPDGTVEEMIVEESKIKPFSDANVDIPRTINDAQAYYIFDSETITRSGAYNVSDFLKQRLTMNTVIQSNGQIAGNNPVGNASSINLRGLGTDKTLILINGRRSAIVNTGITDQQSDLNNIPLEAIERIEVLPSSASGIYGGSAMAGVVNVVLKKDYVGGQLRATYDNTWNTDSSQRTVSGSYGLALEGGKTHLSFNASWSDSKPLLLQDRADIFRNNLELIQSRSPTFIYSSTNPWIGALPNILPASSTATTLTLKNNSAPITLNSRNTYIPAGTSPATSAATLASGLLANAGKWNLDFPATNQSPTGLLRTFGLTPENKSFQTSIRRQMSPGLEVFLDLSISKADTTTVVSAPSGATILATAPTNPFTTDVRVSFPDASHYVFDTHFENRGVTLGAIAQLPASWTGAADFTWSQGRLYWVNTNYDSTVLGDDLRTGVLNPFVDTLAYPLDLKKYAVATDFRGSNSLYDVNLRASGPLLALPWGKPNLTVGLEHRMAKMPQRVARLHNTIIEANKYNQISYKRDSKSDSAYVEATVPLVKPAWLPLLHTLELQASGRSERYQLDTGTPYVLFYDQPPHQILSYGNPTLNGLPYFTEAAYTSKNYTTGLKYQPIQDVTLRMSQATAFLPPTPAQLVKNPMLSTSPVLVNDPRTGQTNVPVYTLSGGNPDLTPQNAKSFNAGIIWEPRWQPLADLRVNVEYYRIEQFNAIGSLSVQQIISQESTYPERITRNGSGAITVVDASSLNLYHRDTAGWDLSAQYSMKTGIGRFSLQAAESIILHLKNQYSQTQPEYDAVNFPTEGGAAKYKTNATLNWEWNRWMAGWTARYFGAYKATGAAGGPSSVQSYGGRNSGTTSFIAQGSDTIPSQTYHDLFLSYTIDSKVAGSSARGASPASGWLRGLSLQLGVRNVFNKVPPLDMAYSNNYYLSPYGDTRLRSYWLSAAKTF